MRFFILFLLCLLASGPLGAGSAQAAPQKGFLPQILGSVEGLSPCKPGGDITRDVGRWLRLMRDGEPFAQTCVYLYWGVSRVQAGDQTFYQVESSQDGQKLLTLLSDQGMTLHVFRTDGPGLKERRVEDGKLVYFWEDDEGYAFRTVVGKNEIHTIPGSEEAGDRHWTDLRLEEMEYLGLDGKGLADVWYGHLFRTKDGRTLKLNGEANSWQWLQPYQGKTLRIQWGKLTYGPGFGGDTLYAVMPGLAKDTGGGCCRPALRQQTLRILSFPAAGKLHHAGIRQRRWRDHARPGGLHPAGLRYQQLSGHGPEHGGGPGRTLQRAEGDLQAHRQGKELVRGLRYCG